MPDRRKPTPRTAHWLGGDGPRHPHDLNGHGGGRDESPDEHAAFAGRIAEPLRTAERLAPDFERRLIEKICGGRRAAGGEWARVGRAAHAWRWLAQPRPIRVSPLAGMALAAGLAGIVCLGTLASVGRLTAGGGAAAPRATPALGAAPAAAPETVHVVRFVLVEPRAARVALVGDFNGWAADATPLTAESTGVWTTSVPLPPGRHEYAFVVDGRRWVADPYAPAVRDEYATESSVITVRGSTGST